MSAAEQNWEDRGGHVQVRTDDDVSPYDNPEPGPLVPGEFAILERGIVLARPHGRGYELRGDVARLSSGALVCRYRTKGVDGDNILTYDRWHPDDNITRVRRPHGVDWVAWAKAKKQSLGGAGELGPRPDAEPEDLVRFKAMFPSVARRLQIDTAPEVTRVFGLGKIFVNGGFGPEFWHDFLDRHSVAADFGGYGQLADCAALTEETLWDLATASTLVANAAAIQLQSGAVQSRYLLEPKHEKMCKRPDLVHCANVTTVFSRCPITVAWYESFTQFQNPF
jgi:hypothetical protein